MDNSDHTSCLLTTNTDISFMSCNANAYAYKTTDLLAGNAFQTSQTQLNLTIPTLPLSSVRANMEINKMGSITYFNQTNNKAYRVSLNTAGTIIQEELFTIDQRAINTNYVDDLLITRDMVIVKFSNSTFYSYNRPQTSNLILTVPRAARISYSSVQSLTWQFVNVDTLYQDFYLYSSPNLVNGANQLYLHLIQPKYSNGAISDIQITQVQVIQMGTMLMTTVEFTTSLVAIGCPSCNSYSGRVDIYDRAAILTGNLNLVRSISGGGDNLQMGQVIESIDNSDQIIFYVGSSTSGAQTQRQFYLNTMMFQKFTQNSTLGYQLLSQTVRNVVSLPQNAMLIGMIGSQMIMKYQGNKGIFSVLSCNQNSYYYANDNTCLSCSSFNADKPFQLALQQTTCNSCADVWYIQYKYKTSTDYINTIYDNRCKSFDPKTLSDYNSVINGGNGNNGGNNGGNNNGGSSNNGTSSGGGSSDGGIGGGAIAGIVIGILALAVVGGIIAYCVYKKKQKEQESQDVREKRIQKKKDKDEKVSAAREKQRQKEKQAADLQSKRIQKKMEKEELDLVKQKEEKEQKKKLEEQKKQDEKKKEEEQKKKDALKNTTIVQNQSGKVNMSGPDGPVDIESQIYKKAPVNVMPGAANKINNQQAQSRPNGEVQDPKDIDVEFSDSDSYSDDEESNYNHKTNNPNIIAKKVDVYNDSEISEERDKPDKINNIQNKQQQNQPNYLNQNMKNVQQPLSTAATQSQTIQQTNINKSQPAQSSNVRQAAQQNIPSKNNSAKPQQQQQKSNKKGDDSGDRLEESKSESEPSTNEKKQVVKEPYVEESADVIDDSFTDSEDDDSN